MRGKLSDDRCAISRCSGGRGTIGLEKDSIVSSDSASSITLLVSHSGLQHYNVRARLTRPHKLLLDLANEIPLEPISDLTQGEDSGRSHQMNAQPSASLKLNAMSMPFVSVHTIRVSATDVKWLSDIHAYLASDLVASDIHSP